MIYEIAALDDTRYWTEEVQLTMHAMQTARVVGALRVPVAVYRHSSFITIVLWCAAALPRLRAPRYHCSTVQRVMGIANHWQSEFHSQPYTRRQFWRSASIYSLPLSPAGSPRSFLSSYPGSAPPEFHILCGKVGTKNRHLTQFIVSTGKPIPTSSVIIWVGWEFDNESLCAPLWGPFTFKTPNCPAHSLGGLLVWSTEGTLLLIL